MARTVIQHQDGTVTTVTHRSGCSTVWWAILGAFVLFAPGVWAANGTIPVVVAVLMYAVEVGLVAVWVASHRSGQTPQPPS